MAVLQPNEVVSFGDGWSVGGIYYELVQLHGGFYELRWSDDSGSEEKHSAWFAEYSEAILVFNSVVAIDGSKAKGVVLLGLKETSFEVWAHSVMNSYEEPEEDLVTDGDIDATDLLEDSMLLYDENPRKLVEVLADKALAKKAARDAATAEHRAAHKLAQSLVDKILPFLGGITVNSPIIFTSSSFDERSTRWPGTEPERRKLRYKVWMVKGDAGPDRVEIKCQLENADSTTWRSLHHRLWSNQVIEYLLGDVSTQPMPW